MESSYSLTKQEMDAVLQLVQLSGGSGDDLRVLWVDFAVGKDKDGGGNGISAAEASSISSSSSSIDINQDMKLMFDEEPLPRINHRFGSLIDVYSKTAPPLIKNRSKKRARF